LTVAYTELCRRTRESDRSLREKVMPLEKAAGLVRDGASVGIGGNTLSRTLMAIWRWVCASAPRRARDRSTEPKQARYSHPTVAADGAPKTGQWRDPAAALGTVTFEPGAPGIAMELLFELPAQNGEPAAHDRGNHPS
jgi:hypothetical protein